MNGYIIFVESKIGLITLEQIKTENVIPEPEAEPEKRSWKEIIKSMIKRKKTDEPFSFKRKRRRSSNVETTEDMDVEDLDWWTKYYASLEVKQDIPKE